MKIKQFVRNNLILIIMFIMLFNFTKVYAEESDDSYNEFLNSRYTDEYIEYLKLSDEEKEKIDAIPRKYKMSFEEYYNNKRKNDTFDSAKINTELPSYFNLRDKINIKVESQGLYGLCWSFTTSTALETNLALNGQDFDFSEMHVNYLTSRQFYEYYNETPDSYFYRNLHGGGNIYQYARYMSLGKGPVHEKLVPYVEYNESQYDLLKFQKPLVKSFNLVEFPYISQYDKYNHLYSDEEMKEFRKEVKTHIMNYGGIYASNVSSAIKYNSSIDKHVCNAKSLGMVPDHAITIVGWDDNFSKNNFPEDIRPQNNGAYIAVNSWGDWWGDNGYFYISYEDLFVDAYLAGFDEVTIVDNPDFELDTTDIKFASKNTYEKMKIALKDYIVRTDDNNNTVTLYTMTVNMFNELTVEGIDDFSGFEGFYNLKYLDLKNCKVSNFNNISNLVSISFTGCELKECNLAGSTALESIYFQNTQVNADTLNQILDSLNSNMKSIYIVEDYGNLLLNRDLDFTRFKKLEELSVNVPIRNKGYVNVKINNLKELKKLTLMNIDLEENSLTSEMNKLSNLILTNSKLNDLKFMNNTFENLQEMKLINNNLYDITNLEYIKNKSQLQLLIINNPINELTYLSNNMQKFGSYWISGIHYKVNISDVTYLGEEAYIEVPKIVEDFKKIYSSEMNNKVNYSVRTNGCSANGSTITLDTYNLGKGKTAKYSLLDGGTEVFSVDITYNTYDKDYIAEDYAKIQYKTHVQNVGWQNYVSLGNLAGTRGQSLRLEGIKIKLDTNIEGNIEYSTHIQNIGWQDFVKNDELSGTNGRSLRLEAIKIRLTGELSNRYDIYYRVHAQNVGWLDWAKNGEESGTEGYGFRLEGIQIMLVEKGSFPPGKTIRPFKSNPPTIEYTTHVQNIGWQQPYKKNGQMAGTSGQSLRLEGIKIRIPSQNGNGDIEYSTHIQNIGWQNFVRNDELSGTSGQSLRLEGIKIRLTGELAQKYDVYYRVHAQNAGWLGWARNGEFSGTSGYGFRLEGIEIKLGEKDASFYLEDTKPSFMIK